MLPMDKSRFSWYRMAFYLILILAVSIFYLFSSRAPKLEYTAVTAAGVLVPTDKLNPLSVGTASEFLIENGKLYLLTRLRNNVSFPFSGRPQSCKRWSSVELRELLAAHPELRPYLSKWSDHPDFITLKLQ